jgi:hypothetical protein
VKRILDHAQRRAAYAYFTCYGFAKGIVLKGQWRRIGRDWARRWDLRAVLLIVAILLTGILSKLNEALWAIVTVLALCVLLAGLHRRAR